MLRLRVKIPRELIRYLLEDARVLDSDKKLLISSQSAFYERDAVSSWLRMIGADDYCLAFSGTRIRVPADKTEQKLIETFIQLGWISSYKADGTEYVIGPKRKTSQRLA